MSEADAAAAGDSAEAARLLARGRRRVVALEDFKPFTQGLEWRLARHYWQAHGSSAFTGGDVPYAVNNDGRLAEDAARVFAHAHAATDGPLAALEVGSGSGIFARLFLRALGRLNPAVAARTTFVATDATEAMVRALAAGGLLAGAAGPVEAVVATAPALAELGDRCFHAIFANYLLDNLGATLVRRRPESIEEIVFRTVVDTGTDIAALTGLQLDTLRERLDRGDADAERALAPHWAQLALEWQALPRSADELPHGHLLAPPPKEGDELSIHGVGAVEFLDAAVQRLDRRGFVLVADYAAPAGSIARPEGVAQHYGGSMAHPVDFDQIDRWSLTQRGRQTFAPAVPSESLQVRLVCWQHHSEAIAAFLVCFDGARWDLPARLLRLAQERLGDHRSEDARDLLLQALAARPWNWQTLERVASFLLHTDKDAAAAAPVISAALELHPLHTGLWNLRGDAHYERRELAAAEAAYRRAIEIDPREIRGRLNLSYVLADTRRCAEALAVLGEALGLDQAVDHRDALLAKQEEILRRQSAAERERLERRLNRVREHLHDGGSVGAG